MRYQNEVPKDWEKVRFDDVTKKITYGFTNPMPHTNNGPWLITAKDIKNGIINYSQAKKTDQQSYEKSISDKSRPKIDTVLITKDGTLGRVGIVDRDNICINQSVASLEPILTKITPKFLAYVLQSPQIMKMIKDDNKSTTIGHIQITKLAQWEFYLPPITLQKKIVLKLESLLEKLEEKKKKILEHSEKKEQSISQLSQKTIGGIIVNHMKLDNPPKDWQIKLFEDCADIQTGFAQGQKNIPDGTIHLRMNNIGRNFQINYNLVRTITPTKNQLTKYRLEKGDVIFNNTNSPELVGKSFIFNDEKTCLFRVKKDLILPEWLLFYIRGKWLRGDFKRMCNQWINQAAIGGAKLKKLEIPIPPLSEQKQILKILRNTSIQFEEIDNLTKMIKIKDLENKKFLEHIRSSILTSAFSGKFLN